LINTDPVNGFSKNRYSVMINYLDIVLYLIIGFASGLLGSMIGLGGGFLTNPILLSIGVNPRFVVSSTRFLTLLVSVSSTYNYSSKLKVPFNIYLCVAIPMTILAFITAYLVAIIDKNILKLIICSVIIFSSIRIVKNVFRKRIIESTGWNVKHKEFLILSGILSGSISGFTGLAGGLINIPLFLTLVKLGVKESITLSLSAMIPSVSLAMLRHVFDNIVNWSIALPLGIGGLIGGLTGPRISLKMNKEKLGLIIGLTIMGVTIRTLIDTLVSILTTNV